jgi:hypothetical protein
MIIIIYNHKYKQTVIVYGFINEYYYEYYYFITNKI